MYALMFSLAGETPNASGVGSTVVGTSLSNSGVYERAKAIPLLRLAFL